MSVAKSGRTVQSFTTATGSVFQAHRFIDASYEGDLLALANVSFTIGRVSILLCHPLHLRCAKEMCQAPFQARSKAHTLIVRLNPCPNRN